MRIGVIGTGYVGLVTGICFADKGFKTTCMDKDKEKIEKLNKGITPFFEPGLDMILKRNLGKNIEFTIDIEKLVKQSDIIFLCLPTPPDNDGKADVKALIEVSNQIANVDDDSYKIIAIKSTAPIGTCDAVRKVISEKRSNFDIVSNPEFLREGSAIEDFFNPDRIVVGCSTKKAENVMLDLYKDFPSQILVMDNRSAEMVKYAANAFLAMKVSFINEIANLCEVYGADIKKVKDGIGTDKRIGSHFLEAGVGWGGSCFPKDVKALIKMGEEKNIEMKIAKAVYDVNERQKKLIVEKMKNRFDNLKGKNIAIWGLSFKPNTDDMRSAPSIDVINELLKHECNITAYDPIAMENAKKIFSNVNFAKNMYQASENSDALIILTEWDDFKKINWPKLKMNQKIIFDGRNVLNPQEARQNGFEYYGIGVK
ncbi:MAG: UDP-glucose/GDP-mannose dehydrogenase family protein [Candidatus Aenigmarchaeota archaeon]|nr:UDP-glucose/GDP-mannose dehydrogenase family protein [Candidatus Aenigmarchaeota archaeon]